MSESAKDTLLLVDGMSMAFRAFFALPVENFSAPDGTPTNAVHGFASMLSTLIQERRPSHVAVAMDLPGGTFRTERLPSYKGTRDDTPPDFETQVPLIRDVLEAMRVPVVERKGFEADDFLATYARIGAEAGLTVWVVSGDRDTLQMVNEHVTVLYPRKGVSELTEFTPDAVREKYDVWPHQYPDLAALVGESSDNLPGVPGVGPKTAAKWISTYGGLDAILAAANEIPGKVGESLREHLDTVRLNRELNHLLTDLEVDISVEDLRWQGVDGAKLHQVADALGFKGLRTRLLGMSGGTETAQATAVSQPTTSVTVGSSVAEVCALEGDVSIVIDSTSEWALGIAQGERAWGIDLGALDAAAERALAGWLATVPVTAHGLKEVMHLLDARGLAVGAPKHDTQVAAYLVNPSQGRLELEDVVERFLGESVVRSAGGQLDLGIDGGGAADAGRMAAQVERLRSLLLGNLDEQAMRRLYDDLEIPLVTTLFRMERTGVAVDDALLASLHGLAAQRAERAAASAKEALGGVEVNLGSPKQLQEVLFDRLGMPKTKKIKTGYTTDAASIQELYEKQPHPFLESLLDYRDAVKLAQIIQTLRDAIGADGRIHTRFSQVVAATGRLSSKDPNLQNIPIRTEEGHRIREAFVVGEGFETLVTADYSQIEMRIMAHLSGDPELIEAFRSGEDLHRYVGARVFGVPPEGVTAHMRSQVKAMSYGLVYGLSAFGLSRQLNLAVGEAQSLMDDYFARFGGVRDYLSGVVRQAAKDGYTETIFGRRRYLPDLTSSNRQRREIAERMALNAPIQGSAADLIKRAMLAVDARIAAEDLRSRQILQVHDELVVEVAPGEAEAVANIVREEMAAAAELSVPLDVNVGRGTNWRLAGH